VIAAFSRFDELAAAITTCRLDPGCRALLDQRRRIAQSFPALWKLLQENRGGRLNETVAERDYDAERARDSHYDARLDALARRRGLSRDNREHEAQLVAELAGDPVASKDPIMRSVRRETGQYRGAAFISGIYRIEQQLPDLYHRAQHALDDVDGKDTAALTTARIDAAAKRFTEVVRDQMTLQENLVSAASFFDPANLAVLSRWVAQSPQHRVQIGELTIREGMLHVGSASITIGLPEFHLVGLTQVLAEVSGDV
jgi:hypothetical protein